MIRAFFICISGLSLLTPAFSQTMKGFTADPVQFPKDMLEFLSEANRKEADKIMERFNIEWTAGRFTLAEQDMIYNVSNIFLKRRLKPFPDFHNYLNALLGFLSSNQSEQAFKDWHSSLEQMVMKSSRQCSDYLEICALLFAGNILYESPSAKWRAGNNEYKFEFDSLPKITFASIDLVCTAKNDSSVIYNTRGSYYPTLKTFFGTGGKVNWMRAGLMENEAYANVKSYRIDITGSDFTLDSVTFFYPRYFKTPLTGTYSDKIVADVTPQTASYPRFNSFNTELEIKELIKDANYKGGFGMHGNKMIGRGDKEHDATLTFIRNNKPFLTASAKSFVVKPDRIVSDNAAVIIRHEKDSIYHPGLEFKYIYDERELTLTRNLQSGNKSPFFNSFHQVDMSFDALTWKVDDPVIDLKMTMGGGESKLVFESSNYFSQHRFFQIQGIADYNPLATIKEVAAMYNSDVVYTRDLAKHMKLNENQARMLLISLANKGFMTYDDVEDRVILKDKLYFYLKGISGKTDYDKLEFESVIGKMANASINLLNFEIKMRGVAQVVISDSQKVYVVPKDQELVLKKNRDFSFAGRVHAGRSDFYGSDFHFRYDDYMFDLKDIDSLRLKVPADAPDETGRIPLIPLKSVLQDVAGELLIDAPENKASRKSQPIYPLFKANKDAYVYYDYASVYDGVYKRDKFYFHLDQFSIDSLDNFSPGGLNFKGEFVSGIFPALRDSLDIMPDLSLGFARRTPPGGFPAYGGKGKFYDNYTLSHDGLQGDGKIDYLSSTIQSKDILFFPDSANSYVQDFEIRRETIAGTQYPHVKAQDVFVNWRPNEDHMLVFQKAKPMDIYDGQTSFAGVLALAPKGLSGNGIMSFEESQLLGTNIRMGDHTFGADTSEFRLLSQDVAVMALVTKNVRSHIDLEKRTGEFVSNGGGSFINFPINQYICFIEQFKWYMDDKEIDLNAVTSLTDKTRFNISGSEFVSVHPSQDSLRFFAPQARYSLKDYFIRATKVKEILVADASIQPGATGAVTIEHNAKMQTLKDATVIANTTSKYHKIQEAVIDIASRNFYQGTGLYEYTDQAMTKHLVNLTRIAVDTVQQTFANGEIPEASGFSLGPNIQYKGGVKINAPSPFLTFNGFARVNHSCDMIEKNWFSFSSEIDPRSVTIPVADAMSESREKLVAALLFGKDSSNIYPAFLSQKKANADSAIIRAEGVLIFDNASKEYRVASKEKHLNAVYPGNFISLNDSRCIMRAEGTLNLGASLGQFKMKTLGKAEHKSIEDSTEFDMIMALDFFFSDEALRAMSDMILSYPTLQVTKDNRPVYENAMASLLGKEKFDRFTADLNLFGIPKKLPDELQKSLFLSDLKMYWNRESFSYRSTGAIGVGFIHKEAIGRMMNGHLEIIRKRSGDSFHLYLELDKNTWYYFSYSRGILQAVSSDIKFNEIISNLKDDKKIMKTSSDEAPYQFILSTDRKKNEFVKRFRETGEQ